MPNEDRFENTPPHVRNARERVDREMRSTPEHLLERLIIDSELNANAHNAELRRTIASLGCIIGKLSKQAEQQARWIIWLTIVLAVLTVSLAAGTVRLIQIAGHTDDEITKAAEYYRLNNPEPKKDAGAVHPEAGSK